MSAAALEPVATPVLAIDGLDVRYGGVTAVRGLDLEVAPGEIVGLIGPNGAGKSTTLHAIMGAVPLQAVTSASPASRCAGGRPKRSRAPASRSCPRAAASTPS